MKKNFMAIASLLIVAMLLVVSCSQEVKAPENNGLVEAKLSVGYGRGLDVSGDTKTDNLTFNYSMAHAWTDPTVGATEEVIGTASNKVLRADGKIGYVTPGMWNITVDAYKDTTKVFSGTSSVYFSSQNQTATVYLAPIGSATNKIVFDITMQDLSKTPDADDGFELQYSIYYGNDSTTNRTGSLRRTTVDPTPANGSATNLSKYSAEVNNLPSGYYRVTVSVYDKKNSKTIGGITKSFLLSNDSNEATDDTTATIKGHIEPSDYENVTINAVYVKVNTELTVVDKQIESGKDYYKYDFPTDGSSVEVTVNVEDKTTLPAGVNKNDVVTTMFWYAVSDVETDNTEGQAANVKSKKFTFNAPGHKYITCTTVYEVTAPAVGNKEATKYYFADTKEAHIYIDPTIYNNGLNASESN